MPITFVQKPAARPGRPDEWQFTGKNTPGYKPRHLTGDHTVMGRIMGNLAQRAEDRDPAGGWAG